MADTTAHIERLIKMDELLGTNGLVISRDRKRWNVSSEIVRDDLKILAVLGHPAVKCRHETNRRGSIIDWHYRYSGNFLFAVNFKKYHKQIEEYEEELDPDGQAVEAEEEQELIDRARKKHAAKKKAKR